MEENIVQGRSFAMDRLANRGDILDLRKTSATVYCGDTLHYVDGSIQSLQREIDDRLAKQGDAIKEELDRASHKLQRRMKSLQDNNFLRQKHSDYAHEIGKLQQQVHGMYEQIAKMEEALEKCKKENTEHRKQVQLLEGNNQSVKNQLQQELMILQGIGRRVKEMTEVLQDNPNLQRAEGDHDISSVPSTSFTQVQMPIGVTLQPQRGRSPARVPPSRSAPPSTGTLSPDAFFARFSGEGSAPSNESLSSTVPYYLSPSATVLNLESCADCPSTAFTGAQSTCIVTPNCDERRCIG